MLCPSLMLKIDGVELSSDHIADICKRSSIREHLIIVTYSKVNTSSIDKSDTKMKYNAQ